MFSLSVRLANDAKRVFKTKYSKMDLAIVEYSIMCGQSTNKLQLLNLHFCMKLLSTLFKIKKSCKNHWQNLILMCGTQLFTYIQEQDSSYDCRFMKQNRGNLSSHELP